MVLFFYNHIMLVKVMDVIIFYVFIRLVFCAECGTFIVVSIGPYSCALCGIWMAYADCGFFYVL